jgi:hypothetical protein
VSAESVDERDRVLVGGVEVSPGEPLAVTPGDTVVVALRPSDAVSLKVEGTLLRTSVAAGRRVLTESRDRFAPVANTLRPSRKRRSAAVHRVQDTTPEESNEVS